MKASDIEKLYPLVPSTWHKCQQYSVAPKVMETIKVAWCFGIGKDAKHEGWIRYYNPDLEVICFDPIDYSANVVAEENVKNVVRRDKEMGWIGKPMLTHSEYAYHPSGLPQEFFIRQGNHSNHSHSFQNITKTHGFDEYVNLDCVMVETRNIKGLLSTFNTPDYIKIDIEGCWFDFCQEIFYNKLDVKQVVGKFDMIEDIDSTIERLNITIDMFKENGFEVFINRKLSTEKENNHVGTDSDLVELAFVKKEYV